MTTVYTRNLLDFPSGLNIGKLIEEINNNVTITPNCIFIKNVGNDVFIKFEATLTAPETTELDNIIANHYEQVVVTSENFLYSTTATSTTSRSYITLYGMSYTPAAGDYIVIFNGNGNLSNTKKTAKYALFKDGVMVNYAEHIFGEGAKNFDSFQVPLILTAKINVNGSETVEIKYLGDDATFTIHNRSLIFQKI